MLMLRCWLDEMKTEEEEEKEDNDVLTLLSADNV